MTNRAFINLAGVLIFACGSVCAEPAPDVSRVAGTPAPVRGRIYIDCISQALAAGSYDQTSNKDAHLLRFHCSGQPARGLYDELATWSAAHDSQWSAQGRTWRATAKIKHDLFGTDYCSTDGAEDYACDLTLNVGDFLVG